MWNSSCDCMRHSWPTKMVFYSWTSSYIPGVSFKSRFVIYFSPNGPRSTCSPPSNSRRPPLLPRVVVTIMSQKPTEDLKNAAPRRHCTTRPFRRRGGSIVSLFLRPWGRHGSTWPCKFLYANHNTTTYTRYITAVSPHTTAVLFPYDEQWCVINAI